MQDAMTSAAATATAPPSPELPQPGVLQQPEPGLRMVLAPNPSPMTHWGTNTFLLGQGAVAVIDPGPDDPRHMAAVLAALGPGERISHILVTHAHRDHSPLARPLSQATGAPVLAFGDARSGRSARMAALAGLEGGEGLDLAFRPDRLLQDGEVIRGDDWELTAIHTPGHIGGHLCFGWGDCLFSGDHVMGWAPSLVSPPEGDMSDYMASLERLAEGPWRRAHAGHGAPITDLPARLKELQTHRRAREAAILAALDQAATPAELTAQVYRDVNPALIPAAQRNLLAHLIDLAHRGLVAAEDGDPVQSRYRRA
ncbi:MBL fold metallo-hydrolase [Gemmobacter serpentinus]|uniref:MBL fold metallo-hydrolase n=1 Tax=Gemmobacter serpentinus TaxID=2652247 RepID=UPI001CF665CE|nr:MBL fold metallo-hydrolase [Gemmobacter serpentinus]